MLAGLSIPARFVRGTVIAELGLFFVGAYYLKVWRRLGRSPQPPVAPGPPFPPEELPWPELRFLQVGISVSVVLFMLAAAADGGGDWVTALSRSLMGVCAALCFAMFAAGFISLFYLWKELVLQLRKASIRSLLLFFPIAICWLLIGLAAMVFLGKILGNIPMVPEGAKREALWTLLGITFYGLWAGRSHAALVLRVILMVLFSSIMVVAVGFAYWWIVAQTTLLLVAFLSAIGALNAAFYSRWVRARALRNNWTDVTQADDGAV
jgi:hypothetical protein